jgi:protein phosphatase 2C family protein 2/3
MGQTLSSPITTKKTESGEDDRFAFGVSEMQGWRVGMEDAHSAELKLDQDNPASNAFFAVYDGHGGANVAKYAGKNVFERLRQEQGYKEGNYREGLKRAFLGVDDDILKNPEFLRDPSGCTAVVALITRDDRIFVANAGDSRCVLGTKGESKPLSHDHKPNNESEMARIFGAGGYVEFGRVNGNLSLARALGDFDYKKNANKGPEDQAITANPEIIEHKMTEDDEFLIIACDGIWDCLTSQQCVDAVRLLISQGKELPEIAEEICELCLAPDTESGAGIGCDNMTMLVVAILNGKTHDQWKEWVTNRVKNDIGHATPRALPQLYPPNRLEAFKMKRNAEPRGSEPTPYRVIELMGKSVRSAHIDVDTDSDDSDDMDDPFPLRAGGRNVGVSNSFKHLQLNGEPGRSDVLRMNADEHMAFESFTAPPRETPSLKPLPNGTTMEQKPPQFQSLPGSDEAPPVVEAEGLMDVGEDPLLSLR